MDIFIGWGEVREKTCTALQPWKVPQIFENSIMLSAYFHECDPITYNDIRSRYTSRADFEYQDGSPRTINDALRANNIEVAKSRYMGIFKQMAKTSPGYGIDDTPYTFREIVRVLQSIYGEHGQWRDNCLACMWNVDISRFQQGLIPYTQDVLSFKDRFLRWKHNIQIYETKHLVDETMMSIWSRSFKRPVIYQIHYRDKLFWMFGDAHPTSKMVVYFVPDAMLDLRAEWKEEVKGNHVLEESRDNVSD